MLPPSSLCHNKRLKYLLTCVYFPPPSLLASSVLPTKFQKEIWRIPHCHSFGMNMERWWCTSKVDTVTSLQSALHKRLELLHTNHHFQLSSARQLPNSTQTLGIVLPKQLGGAPEHKFQILDLILAKFKIKNMHEVFNFIRSISPSQYAVNCP